MYKGTIEQPSAIEAESENGSSRVDESLAFSLGDVPVQLAKQTVVPDSIESQHTPSILGAGGGQNEEQTFYGSSSAGNFLQNVKKLAAQTVHNGRQSHPNHVTTSNRADASLPNGQQLAQPLADYTLPSRRTADRLVTVYWQQMQPIYPFLDELSFQATYETLWTGNSSVINERSFLCSLFAIFAIATQLSGPTIVGERERSAARFATQAKQFWNALDTPSLSLIESYLLLSLYYQSTHEAHTCWLLVGLATRTAQSLGLHHPETSAQVLEEGARERMRRLWYGCVLMDRTLSMTYGRPYVRLMGGKVLQDSVTHRAVL
ncbi:hypothetical protein LTR09_006205 [Extremus antarcticus]|uniref:Xylanolytic transcriptional activator regulatory domain-containing protein n=1 Tax=Extremus antarcticus TaxID=702011 RepID=A0AAJ0GBU0_9PEZI|nr:hypothetical protein LTR09_006205 [Extremus antarcticus]